MKQPLTPPPLAKVKLTDFDAAHVEGDWDKDSAAQRIEENTQALAELAHRLYAEDRRSVLLVLQGMDTSGKDGTIRKVTTGVNPLSFQITAFKQPTPEEMDHDFLWRVHHRTPNRGHIGIFNRSHYEDVVIVRVHELVTESVWKRRYDQINDFERLLVENGVTLVKCFLHISKDEQRERLQERLKDPTKRWKFNAGDLDERKRWDEYVEAYEDALTRCNTEHAPWHIVPADRKWYRNLVVSTLLRETLERMDPQYPPDPPELKGLIVN
jgi:PPK2 family polyphosphate:nucleotide phosphotransferase